jgi:tetratricopeptide (TPR) repeat protein
MAQPRNREWIDAQWARLSAGAAQNVLEAFAEDDAPLPEAALQLRALTQWTLGNTEQSLADLEAVLRIDAQNPVALLWKGLALARLGRSKEAAQHLRHEAVLLPHRQWIAHFLRTFWPQRQAMRFTVDLPDARDPFNCDYKRWKSLALESPDVPPGPSERRLADRYHTLAMKKYIQRQVSEAAFLFARAGTVDPTRPDIAVHSSFADLMAGHPERALARTTPLIQQFLQSQDDRDPAPAPELLFVWGWALHEMGDFRQSLLAVSCVHPEGPDDWFGHFLAAVNWLQLGRDDEFREALDLALDRYFIDTWEFLLLPFIERVLLFLSGELTELREPESQGT